MSRLWVQLAKAGDILNVLPILKAEADAGSRPSLMVHRDFASILEGISYCDCVPFDGHWLDLDRAMDAAHRLSKDVKCVQVHGSTEAVKKHSYGPAGLESFKTDSFIKETYRIADRMDLWRTQPTLVFDRRNQERELALRQTLPAKAKRIILVTLSGISSPFPYKRTLMEMIRLKFKTGYAIVDISETKAQALFDLLALYDQAHCLIASDSAPLHLAQACPNLPVIALTQDEPNLWFGSPMRPNHIAYIRYGDFALRAVEILEAIEGIKDGWMPRTTPVARIIHAWSHYDVTQESHARHQQAKETWQEHYETGHWLDRPMPIGGAGRDSEMMFKDKQRSPYLKDVIRIAAMAAAHDDAVICLTRADTCFENRHLTDYLLNGNLPIWSPRIVREDGKDSIHPVCDLFAFTLGWWKQHQDQCPELIMGQDVWWARVFMSLLKKGGGRELRNATYRGPWVVKPSGPNPPKYFLANENAHKKWQDEHGEIVLSPKVQDQIETIIVNRHALLPAAYNPSIVRHNGKLLMAYRWHSNQDTSTALAISEIDEAGNVKNTHKLELPRGGGSCEDPHFFMLQGELHMSYVDSTWPKMPPQCVTKYGKLDTSKWRLLNIQRPDFGRNDMTAAEKNWCLFEADGKLWCIYQSSPKQIVYGDSKPIESEALHWKWGPHKGGCAPVKYGDSLLRFFHSTLDNELPPYRRRYFLGACVMESEPPFKQLAMSREPIVVGSEIDQLKALERGGISHYKPKVIFPGGAVESKDGWIVSCGINDSQCALLTITEKDLKL